MSVLDELIVVARRRAAALPAFDAGHAPCRRPSFADALRGKDRLAVIAEFKRASPSEGGIAPAATIGEQLGIYESAGAAAVSVLTESSRFGGSPDDLAAAAECTALPLLMKDFVVDERQVQLAAALGASACLLIVRCLDQGRLRHLAVACESLALTPLIECHDMDELDRALEIDSAVIGINNRDLDSLEIDIARAPEMLRHVPPDRVCVAESGYLEPAQTASVRGLADAVLVGTSLMRSPDPAAFIAEVAR